jgi:hypothetical protein
MSGYNVTIGSTSTNVTVGYRPTLGVTQQASGIVGPAGPGIGTTSSINTTGIITASYFVGDGSLLTNIGYANTAGIATNVIGGIASVTQLNVSGITTVGFITATNLYVAGVGTFLSSGLKIRNPANTFGYTIAGGAIAADRTLTLPVVTSNTGIAVTGLDQSFTGTQTFTNIGASAAITFNTIASNILIGTGQTNPVLTLGGASQTGTMTLGQSTVSQTTNIQAGVSGVGTTKTINFGTGGASGSFTQINIGPTAGVGTVIINSGTNLGIGSATPTSALTVVGDARVSGVVTASTFIGSLTGTATTAITALGLSTTASINTSGIITAGYFVGDGSGLTGVVATGGTSSSQWTTFSTGISTTSNVGIGTTNATSALTVVGNASVSGITTTNDLYVAGVGTFLSSGLKIRNVANTFNYTIAGGVITNNRTLTLPAVSSADTIAVLSFAQTFLATQTFNNGIAVSSNLTYNAQTGSFTATALTSGGFIVGGPLQTGEITLGQSSVTHIVGIATGITSSGNTKTINLGTGGATGSFTQINIGPTAGVGTVLVNTGTRLGIGSAIPTSALDVIGDARVSGVVTATTFIGNLTGTASTASSVVLDSVGLGTHTYGDYVKSISGTSNQISVSATSGEGSTPTLSIPNQFTIPQDATVTRDLQVNRNLNVTGNITIGGTSATLFSQSLNIFDPDIVLGFRTDAFGNDVSTDNTANHGGVALASTEGTPLIDLFIAGIETNPSTYKKIMWFKSGTFSGLGTDAWLINYAVGIGSTQVPNGVRLAAGGMQVTDSTITTPNLNVTGFTTTNNLNVSGISTFQGQIISTRANSTTTGGGQIYLNGATGNRIDFNTNGTAAPSFTTRSVGTKIVLYPLVGASSVDYAFGIEPATLWSSISDSSNQFKWYAGTTNIATLFGTGQLVLGTTSLTGTASQPLQVTGGAYVSGNLGIGTTNPTSKLDVFGGNIRAFGTVAPAFIVTPTSGSSYIFGANTGITGGGIYDNTAAIWRLVVKDTTGNTGIGTTNPVSTLQVKDALAFETTNTTTSSTSQVAVDTFATATFRSAKYQVQMTCPGQIATLGGITTGGSGYTAGTFNVTFSNSSGTGAAAQGTLTISNGTVGVIGLGTTGGSGYITGDVLTASGGSGLQVSVASTASPSGRILTLGSITSAGIGYTAGVGVGTTTLAFLGGTGTGAIGLATIFDGVITSSTLLQQPTTGTGGTVFYSGSNYTTSTVLTINKTDVTNTITTITGSVGVSTFTSLTAHGIGVSDAIRVSSTSNGLTAATDYYVVTVPTTTTFTLGSSVGIGTTFTTGSSLSIGFYRNSANAGGNIAYTNAITGVSTNYQVSDLLVLQNGTTADFVEYGTIANTDILGTFAADISGANARLLVTPTYATNTVKVARQAITV